MNVAVNNFAIEIRNKSWANNEYIPSWVDIDAIGLDQFFTHPSIAKACWDSLCKYMQLDGVNIAHYKFVEPGAGLGAFYDLLPKNRCIGIDVVRFRPEYIQKDFLTWLPRKNGYSYACVGNPPFGYRAWLALAFLNHAAKFSNYVGFILPMAFQSRGKSNVQDRVRGLHLAHSSPLPSNSFVDADGNILKVNALWQIWTRSDNKKVTTPKTCNQYIDLFTVDMRKERLCGQKRLDEADFFLQRTFYTKPPSLVTNFDQVKYVCGYGIVIKRDRRKVLKALRNADWKHYSNLASHNCRHISMGHIRAALTDRGFIDR
ncbi:MAG: hypothetical protein HYV37_03390 [Candidatus Levyibacteriota bacterium]|nr:MAG: hypothetical protein HYV37_03390 [Candidatus Levybacteria bacterium]